jgi:hypothetical protein
MKVSEDLRLKFDEFCDLEDDNYSSNDFWRFWNGVDLYSHVGVRYGSENDSVVIEYRDKQKIGKDQSKQFEAQLNNWSQEYKHFEDFVGDENLHMDEINVFVQYLREIIISKRNEGNSAEETLDLVRLILKNFPL